MSVAGSIVNLFKFGNITDLPVESSLTSKPNQILQVRMKNMENNMNADVPNTGASGSQQARPKVMKQNKGPTQTTTTTITTTSGRQTTTTTGPQVIDENMFTFKPKVSAHSVKIAESLGTSFMSRQQHHLEKQRKYMEQASMQYRSISSMGSVNFNMTKHSPKKERPKEESDSGEKVQTSSSVASSIGSQGQDDLAEDRGNPVCKTQSTPTISKSKNIVPKSKSSSEVFQLSDEDLNDGSEVRLTRSRTMPPATMKSHQANRRLSTININLERVKNAKITAERAIKTRKIFTIQGPYPAIRESLRKRGWVEKFYKLHMAPPPKKSPRVKKKKAPQQSDSDDDDDDNDDDDDDDDNTDDDDDDAGKIPPWEEDNGIYGIMSRVVRNSNPTFIWSVRRDAVDPRYLRKDQIINHYGKATFTTKVGLCLNMRQVPWFEQADPDSFFPRCYRLSHDEEKQSFVDDYRLTACVSVMKMVLSHLERNGNIEGQDESMSRTNVETPNGHISSHTTGIDPLISSVTSLGSILSGSPNSPRKGRLKAKKKGGFVPMKTLDIAINHCEKYLQFCAHLDLDNNSPVNRLLDTEWEEFLTWYYSMVHDDAVIQDCACRQEQIEIVLERMKEKWTQYELDGTRGVWIVKPGAKSRGRGIIPFDRLEDMLKLVSSSVVKKDSKFVVQKYIEKPLLIYNTKFDIRQWFVVTDWNPLTLWFYRDSYLRFCSQEFTLEDFDEAIHLANNAIQCHYDCSKTRSSRLPDQNMWSSDEFKNYLNDRGQGHVWEEVIYPGMKKAVICALLCTQDIVEYRKSAFELYGADFMLTEDFHPWLIEINSSPSMSYSTKVTADLCPKVLEDTVKVALDRKFDRNADIGAFELAYKQPLVSVPPYIGINLTVEGAKVKKPTWMAAGLKEGDQPAKQTATAIPRVANIAPRQINQSGPGKTVVYRHQQNPRLGPQPIPVKSDQTPKQSKSKTEHTVPTAVSAPIVPFSEKEDVLGPDGKILTQREIVQACDMKPHPPACLKSPRVDFKQLCSKHKNDSETLNSKQLVQGQKLDTKTPVLKLFEGTPGDSTGECTAVQEELCRKSDSDKTSVVSQLDQALLRIGACAAGHSEDCSSQSSGHSETKKKDNAHLKEVKAESYRVGHQSSMISDVFRGRNCPVCGHNSTYRLQLSTQNSCRCQQDGVRYKLKNWKLTHFQSYKGYYEFVPRPPSATSVHNMVASKRLQVDQNKLLASVCSKTRNAEKTKVSNRPTLKCTDASIKIPVSTLRTSVNSFPKLSKYVTRKSKDEVLIFQDPYKAAGSKLTTAANRHV